jgi:hypothetical protein
LTIFLSVLFRWRCYCLSFLLGHFIVCPFSLGHFIVCLFSFCHFVVCPLIYNFWLSLWYLQTYLKQIDTPRVLVGFVFPDLWCSM